ncbi:hypothetical protein HZS_646 [Henneguya salminicola]|nr:hypothetical protein HZS_646 [Henneguya salminicola]
MGISSFSFITKIKKNLYQPLNSTGQKYLVLIIKLDTNDYDELNPYTFSRPSCVRWRLSDVGLRHHHHTRESFSNCVVYPNL